RTDAPTSELVDRLAHPGDDEVAAMDAWWRANNYLTVGQIYLMANPLLREPLAAAHIKPRLLGHWGTSPGLSFIYAHASRLIRHTDSAMIYLAGPGHGGPALVAAAVVGDGEAETGPLEGSWKGISFLDPSRDGAVLPILHLNAAKISGPTVLGRK